MACIVSFHAHPDDEVLLTGGSLARWHAAGHRIVLVVATDGAAGESAPGLSAADLARVRHNELASAAAILGVDRIVHLGLPDSGWPTPAPGATFSRLPAEDVAGRLARVLREEAADTLTVYDPAGGYGHPDHRAVHTVGVLAAALAGTPQVLEATVDRARLLRAVRLVQWLPRLPAGFSVDALAGSYSAPERITHRLDVRALTAVKRRAMQAHVSQSLGHGDRTLAWALRLPPALFTRVFGTEWFVEHGAVGRSDQDPVALSRAAPRTRG